MQIKDKVVLVTGASRGIGRALAWELLESGAFVVLASRNETKLETSAQAFVRENPSYDSRIMVQALDVCQEISCRQAVDQVAKKWGRLDIVVNNAGFGLFGPASLIPLSEIYALFDTNFYGAIRVAHAAFPLMVQSRESCMVMISSINGKKGLPWCGYYGASKAAMNTFAESIRAEWAGYGMHVLTVMPGATESDFGKNAKYFGGICMPWAQGRGEPSSHMARLIREAIEKDKKEIIPGLHNKLSVFTRTKLSFIMEPVLSRVFAPWNRKDT